MEEPCHGTKNDLTSIYQLMTSIPLQLLACHAAIGRGVDKPRNLAKSVTVE